MDEHMLQDVLESAGFGEWTIESEYSICCPHGHVIEWDGECPDGCVSALRQIGLI